MANAIKMLQDDHNSVRILFGQFHQVPAGQGDVAENTATQIASLLTTHAALEEEFIYPALAEIDSDLAEHSKDEHAEVKRLLGEIEGAETGREGNLSALLTELQTNFESHVTEEEDKAFPLLTENLGISELEDMGRLMLTRQQELMQENAEIAGAAQAGRPAITTPRI
jgi:iron-sulfur cluster repair protein YtfE (RIC family)